MTSPSGCRLPGRRRPGFRDSPIEPAHARHRAASTPPSHDRGSKRRPQVGIFAFGKPGPANDIARMGFNFLSEHGRLARMSPSVLVSDPEDRTSVGRSFRVPGAEVLLTTAAEMDLAVPMNLSLHWWRWVPSALIDVPTRWWLTSPDGSPQNEVKHQTLRPAPRSTDSWI